MFVLDCSIAVAWLFEDEATPQTDALLERLNESGSSRSRSVASGTRQCSSQSDVRVLRIFSQDSDLERLYVFLRHLVAKSPRRKDGPAYHSTTRRCW